MPLGNSFTFARIWFYEEFHLDTRFSGRVFFFGSEDLNDKDESKEVALESNHTTRLDERSVIQFIQSDSGGD